LRAAGKRNRDARIAIKAGLAQAGARPINLIL
jgi:hypothetical protein